MQKSGVNFTTE
jgi:hypothetical protein